LPANPIFTQPAGGGCPPGERYRRRFDPIGRGTSCKLRLLDQRVALHHATLRQSSDAELYIETEGEATLRINGVAEQNAALTPGIGGDWALSVDSRPSLDGA